MTAQTIPSPPAMYCRKCGYQLKGLAENRCPECGRVFAPDKPKTFYGSYRRWQIMHIARRAYWASLAVFLLLFLVAALGVFHLRSGWQAEQLAGAAMERAGAQVERRSIYEGRWARLFGAFGYTLERVVGIQFRHSEISDGEMAQMNDLPYVANLLVSGKGVTSNGLQYLKDMKRLTWLELWNTHVDDDGLAHLAGLTDLRYLRIVGGLVTDAGIQHMQKLQGLENLGLREVLITDGALPAIGRMTRLKWLDLKSDYMTDAGLQQLAGLTQLEQLSLSSPQITEKGLRYLSAPSLQYLILDGDSIADEAAAWAGQLPQLRTLQLTGGKVTDAGLRHLAELNQLEELYLSSPHITDNGLKHLSRLPHLRGVRLYFYYKAPGPAGIEALKGALPGVQVEVLTGND